MQVASAVNKDDGSRAPRRGKARAFHASKRLAAAVEDGHVVVDFSIGKDPSDLVLIRDALAAAGSAAISRAAATMTGADVDRQFVVALEKAAESYLAAAFTNEFEKLVADYRLMLRENLARGDDTQLKSALNRARLQERILASTPMADQGEACELLGLSGANPSATMKRKEDRHELLRFTVDGRAVYPLVQFDVEGRRIYPAIGSIIAAMPGHWSNFRLLHWLTRPHLDFNGTPGESLGDDADAVIAAFMREIEPEFHG